MSVQFISGGKKFVAGRAKQDKFPRILRVFKKTNNSFIVMRPRSAPDPNQTPALLFTNHPK
ncbi:MAG TPA: hypothetical protein VIK53_04080 [Verrucomicrobiae bacterium]